jgi:hypothetical protein
VAPANERTVEVPRPRRPALVELAAAILIIGSATDAAISIEGVATATTAESRFLALASVVVGLWLVVLGLLIRNGRAWLVAINVVAIAAFLELRSVTFVGLLSAILDFVVVAILLRTRWWFQWRPPDDAEVTAAADSRWRGSTAEPWGTAEPRGTAGAASPPPEWRGDS